jgi:membrane protein
MADEATTHSESGREAERPRELGARGWRDTLVRVRREAKRDNLSIVGAGVAYFAFLAIFPALGALVSLYGLVADPAQVEQQVSSLRGVLPAAAVDLVGSQLHRLAGGSTGALSWGLALSVALALWSANKGVKALVQGLNIAYDEDEDRSWIKRVATTLGLTLGGIVAGALAIALVVALPAVLGFVGLGSSARLAVEIVRWIVIVALLIVALAVVYRFGPARDAPRWRWISPGAVVAAVLWLIGSVLFSIYVSRFGSYAETYGALGAVVILLIWFYLTAFVVLLGAELNAEAERQTRRDTTKGPSRPMGTRGAQAANTLGESPT